MRLLAAVLVCCRLWFAAPAQADDAVATIEPGSDPWAAVPTAVALAPDPPADQPTHRGLALGALGGMYGAFSVWAYFAWYADHPHEQGFVFGGDGWFGVDAYAGGSDKLGHAWATMVLGRMSSQVLRFGGWDRRRAAMIGSGLSFLLFTLVEYQDAYYYEFSVSDLTFDALGAAASAVLEASPRADELFDFRVEYWPSDEYKAVLRGDLSMSDIKKVNFAEDYSGQTYLLAFHLGGLPALADRRWTSPLRYVDVVAGFQSNKYRPAPPPEDTARPTQTAFLGVSLDLQAVFDRVLDGGGRKRRGVKALLHGVSEIVNLPFTSVPLVGVSRACPGRTPDSPPCPGT